MQLTDTLTANARQHIVELFQEKLTEDHRFHDLAHTLSVKETALILGRDMGLSEEELEILELAGLFHDSGFTRRYIGHEKESQKIAQDFLQQQGYPTAKTEQVLALIAATRPEYVPQNDLEKIIRDADMGHLGREHYLLATENLRHEWEVFLDKEYDDLDWLRTNFTFLKQHEYQTEAAQKLFGEQLENNKKAIKKMRKKERKIKEKAVKGTTISGSSTARMAFKTALRNHIDLTAIADNKANIMLSINAIIITITMPLLANNIRENEYLLIPTSILLVTCVLSIIFATLATRPIKTTGVTDLENIKKQHSNLFFFGNFYRMPFSKYREGIDEIVGDQDVLEDSVIFDLYGLGKALGSKFNQLRICYGIFMVGMTITVIAFAIAFFNFNAAGG